MGRSRGGLTTKIHALVDAEGRPNRMALTPGQAGDAPAAIALIDELAQGAIVIADRAYHTDAIRAHAALQSRPRLRHLSAPPRVSPATRARRHFRGLT